MQTIQSKYIRHCLLLNNRSHTGMKDFGKINWFSLSQRFNQYLFSNSFKFFKETFPQANTGSSVLKPKHPLKNSCSGQNNLFYLTPILWNSLTKELKLRITFNNFKHKLKKLFFSIDWSSLFSRLLASVLVLIVPRSCFCKGSQ